MSVQFRIGIQQVQAVASRPKQASQLSPLETASGWLLMFTSEMPMTAAAQSSHCANDFREGLLYISKLSLKSDDHQVTAVAWAEPVLSICCSRSAQFAGVDLRAVTADCGKAAVPTVKPKVFALNPIIRRCEMLGFHESTMTRPSQEWRGAG